MIQTFIDWLVSIITTLGYPGVALSVFIESFFAPIPSEIILPFSGFVASTGALNIYWVIVVATLAAYLGTLPFYFIGRWGEKYVFTFLDKYGKYLFIDRGDVDWAFGLFEKHGNKIVLGGRLIPIVRTLISFPAGVAKMKFVVFSIYTLIGAFFWNTLLAYAGYLLADSWESVGAWIGKYEKGILVVGVLLVVLYFLRGYLRKRKSTNVSS
ncbi:MAG: DedA family protein [Candidatus Dojkabacteria bacterium]|jgi:membrane protein DedA with SNARE-associated domain|nr:DedA family protein [Candidatus Dojkabacteria bacterium]